MCSCIVITSVIALDKEEVLWYSGEGTSLDRPRDSLASGRGTFTNSTIDTLDDQPLLIDLTDQPNHSNDSHVIPNTQSKECSQAGKNSNITCGNCGEKGHNRTYLRCPRYHTAEESARREVSTLSDR